MRTTMYISVLSVASLSALLPVTGACTAPHQYDDETLDQQPEQPVPPSGGEGEASCAPSETLAGGVCVCNVLSHLDDNTDCGCSGPCDIASGLMCSGGECVCPQGSQSDPTSCGCPAVTCDLGAPCTGGACGTCIAIEDLTIFPSLVSGDAEIDGHGPAVTVEVHLSLDAANHILTVLACVDMMETNADWTHGYKCETKVITDVYGSSLAGPAEFLLKYTDTDHDPDDAFQKASSIVPNPAVLGVTCVGDTSGDDLSPECSGECARCTIQFGCVAIAH